MDSRRSAEPTPEQEPGAGCVLRLAPLLLPRARRGIVGSSRYARRLRDDIREASQDPERQPVLISGEPGLEKDNVAALIHFSSAERKQLMIRLNGALLRPDGADLFGRGSSEETPPRRPSPRSGMTGPQGSGPRGHSSTWGSGIWRWTAGPARCREESS